MVELVYATNFEDIVKLTEHTLNIPIANWFEFEGPSEGEGGASIWMEGLDRVTPGIIPHSGNRCLGMELTDITLARRNEFNLMNLRSLVGDDFLVSVWLYLQSDWGLHAPNIDWNWYSIMAPFGQMTIPWQPYLEIGIGEKGIGGGSGIFTTFTLRRTIDGVLEQPSLVDPFPLPRGRWFNLQYELHRRDVDSRFKVTFDNQVVCDVSGFPLTMATGEFKITPAKIYHEPSDITPHYLWVDDLEIWKLPTTPTPGLKRMIPMSAAFVGGIILLGLSTYSE